MSTPKPKRISGWNRKQQRTTSWERKCDGFKFERSEGAHARRKARIKLGPCSVQDIERISLTIKRTNLTRVDEDGVMTGEAVDALMEDRTWSEV